MGGGGQLPVFLSAANPEELAPFDHDQENRTCSQTNEGRSDETILQTHTIQPRSNAVVLLSDSRVYMRCSIGLTRNSWRKT